MYVVEGKEKWFTSSIYWTMEQTIWTFIHSFVMILGYGIIAVPTGIVTAEIAKKYPK
jgi:voltage-gated potassium channel